MRNAPLAVALALLGAGCFHHVYHVGTGAPAAPMVYNSWHNHFLFGIIGEDAVDVSRLCPSGNATIRNDITPINGVICVLIGVIYCPTTVEVHCAGAPEPAPPRSGG
jgi:Bor protein